MRHLLDSQIRNKKQPPRTVDPREHVHAIFKKIRAKNFRPESLNPPYCNLSQLETSRLKVIFANDTVFKTSKLPIVLFLNENDFDISWDSTGQRLNYSL